jgi:hypothetical protein
MFVLHRSLFYSELKRLELSIIGDPPKAEFTLIYILYGICQVKTLEDLRLTNVTVRVIRILSMPNMSFLID